MSSATGQRWGTAGVRSPLRFSVRVRPTPPRPAQPQVRSHPSGPHIAPEQDKRSAPANRARRGPPAPPIRSIRPKRLDLSDSHAVRPPKQR